MILGSLRVAAVVVAASVLVPIHSLPRRPSLPFAMAPPLPTRPLGVPLLSTSTSPTIVVELFQDLCCPFSRKMTLTLDGTTDTVGVLSKIKSDTSLSSRVEFIFHNVPQPWHPQSSILHECMMAVSIAVNHDPPKVMTYVKSIFEAWPKFADKYTADKSRREIHEMCADIAADCLGEEGMREKVMENLDFSHLTDEEPNMALGETTKLLKFAIKHHRKRGVHVTPTVFINSIEAPDISSSWTVDEWMVKLRSLL